MSDAALQDVRLPDGRSGELTGRLHIPASGDAGAPTVALTHGASGSLDTPGLVAVAERIAGGGVRVLRFNLPSAEAGRRRPDHPRTAIRAVAAVAGWAAEQLPGPLFLGGRSFGGRMASLFLAETPPESSPPVAGGVFLAYPLRPPGRREIPPGRAEHLPRIRRPTLFVSGSRDPFAPAELIEPLVAEAGGRMVWIPGANHGFGVRKKDLLATGRTAASVLDEVAAAVIEWLMDSAPQSRVPYYRGPKTQDMPIVKVS